MHSSTNETQTLSAGGGLHHTDRFCKALLIWVLCVKTLRCIISAPRLIERVHNRILFQSKTNDQTLLVFFFFHLFWVLLLLLLLLLLFFKGFGFLVGFFLFHFVFLVGFFFFGGGVFVCVCFLFCLFGVFFWGGDVVCVCGCCFFLFVCLLFFFLFGKEGGVVAFEIIILAPLQDQFRVEIVRKNTCVD